jgi:SMP-30/Gluconolactonase/LRE-like region
MSILRIARPWLIACAGASLAACGNATTPTSTLAPPVSGAAAAHHAAVPSVAARPNAAVRLNHKKSWVSPDAKRAPRLLFITDYGAGDVNILTMPDLALKGTLTGFSYPEGACSDASGDIWIANTGASQMLLYSRTGTLIKTLAVPYEYPAGCAINKRNNDLAVINIEDTSGNAGNVMVFKNATGAPATYTAPNFYLYFFAGYDDNGNLFFDGQDVSRLTSYLAELPNGSGNPQLLTISGATWHVAGFVQWYHQGGYLALGDQECNGYPSACIFFLSISGSTANVTGGTTLTTYQGNPVCDLAEGVIAANGERYLAGADYESCGYTPITANRWAYPAGAAPTNYNDSVANFVEPLGAAVSTK